MPIGLRTQAATEGSVVCKEVMMSKKRTLTPWHEVVSLRDDLKSGELSLAVFAADLYDVLLQKGQRKIYEDPAEFFALTYPTLNLRELVRDVAMRLAGRSDKAYRKLSVTYGGGKTHTLITLRHLVHDPSALPDLPAVRDFKAHIDFPLPHARVAALCFDKIDLELGVETPAPDGSTRMLRHPWSVLAYQLAGADGLRMINASGKDEERDTAPAEPPIVALLSKPQGGRTFHARAPGRSVDVSAGAGRDRAIGARAHGRLLSIPDAGGRQGGPLRDGCLVARLRSRQARSVGQ